MSAKIMIVEDDINLREIYQARLQAEGYEIVPASDGEEALAIAVKEHPDLIISDVMMPKISGFDMLDILRGTEGIKETKVIMMTALGQAEDKLRADKLGADRYLVKSQVTLEDVIKTVNEVLEGNNLSDQDSKSSTQSLTTTEVASPATDATLLSSTQVDNNPSPKPNEVLQEPIPTEQPSTAQQPESNPIKATVQTMLPNTQQQSPVPQASIEADQTTSAEQTTVLSQIKQFVDNQEGKNDTNQVNTPVAKNINTVNNSGNSMKKVISPLPETPQPDLNELAEIEEAKDLKPGQIINDITPPPTTIVQPSITIDSVPKVDPNQIAL